MPEINIIFDHLGLGITKIKISNDKTFSDLVTKYCKTKCLSKKLMPKLRYIFIAILYDKKSYLKKLIYILLEYKIIIL